MNFLTIVFCFVLALFAIFFIAAWPFMWTWNYAVVGAISVCNPVDYWTAYWLLVFLSPVIVGFGSNSRGN